MFTKRAFLFFYLFVACFIPSLHAATSYDPIAVYLTWQRNPETTMTIHWITRANRKANTVEYRQASDNQWSAANGSSIHMPEQSPYLVHTVELINLKPDCDYVFRPGKDAVEYKFRTLPALLEKPLRFIVGGDMYHDSLKILHETNIQAARTDPQFALVGGDIAYAVSGFSFLPSWIQLRMDHWHSGQTERWLEWLVAWKRDMVTSDGRLIPILPAIGNHDTNGRFGQTPAESPYFYSLFAMPGSQGYNVLDIGNYMSLLILDSGHTHPIGGEQEKWLADALHDRVHVPNKFALYHVPAYPSVRSMDNEYSSQVRQHWVPLFEKYGLTAAFEHHDHAYKRTHPILQNHVDPSGVLYLGDGAWGMKKPRQPKNERWYLAKTASARHFILVTLDSHNCYFTAIASNGVILDSTKK